MATSLLSKVPISMPSSTLQSPSSLHLPTPSLSLSPSSSSLSSSSSSFSSPFALKLSSSSSSSSSYISNPRHLLTVCKVSKGDVAPPFSLKDQNGRNVSLSNFKSKPIVLYFYPADETPGCTKQACAFRDSYEKFKKAGAQVIGVSGDSSESHNAFAKKYRLPYTLLSDEGNKLRKEWGVPGDFFGALPGRQTYVIDKKGIVQLVFNNQFQPEKHIDETLKALQKM